MISLRFDSLEQQSCFLFDGEKWIKVGINLALNSERVLKWFEDQVEVQMIEDQSRL